MEPGCVGFAHEISRTRTQGRYLRSKITPGRVGSAKLLPFLALVKQNLGFGGMERRGDWGSWGSQKHRENDNAPLSIFVLDLCTLAQQSWSALTESQFARF